MKEGERSVQIGKRNRNRILNELLESHALTFTELKKKVPFTAKTLTDHLKNLQEEKLVKREIHGKYIKYVLARPQTVLQMRKDFQKELVDLILRYDSCLNLRTHNLLAKPLKALQESIDHPEAEAETSKIFRKTITIPKGFKGTVTQSIGKIYEKPKFVKSEEPRKPGRKKTGSRR